MKLAKTDKLPFLFLKQRGLSKNSPRKILDIYFDNSKSIEKRLAFYYYYPNKDSRRLKKGIHIGKIFFYDFDLKFEKLNNSPYRLKVDFWLFFKDCLNKSAGLTPPVIIRWRFRGDSGAIRAVKIKNRWYILEPKERLEFESLVSNVKNKKERVFFVVILVYDVENKKHIVHQMRF